MPYHYVTERKKDFHICTSCFSLTDLTKKSSQRCKCEPAADFYSWDPGCNFLLCIGCARVVNGGESRFSWLACSNCRITNEFIEKKSNGSLPFFRHSIGNGYGIKLASNGADLATIANQVSDLFKLQRNLANWSDLLARQLFETVAEWQKRQFIHTAEWEHKLPSSLLASAISLQGFMGEHDFIKKLGIQPKLNLELLELAQKKGLVTKEGKWFKYQSVKWQGYVKDDKFCAGDKGVKRELISLCYDLATQTQMKKSELIFCGI
jgi:hypothetical protein